MLGPLDQRAGALEFGATAPAQGRGDLSHPPADRTLAYAARTDVTLRTVETLGDVEISDLDRVIGLGHRREAGGVVLEILACEIRETGAIIHWRISGSSSDAPGGPDISVADDVGSSYTVIPGAWRASDRISSGVTVVVPAPPNWAAAMTILVAGIGLPVAILAGMHGANAQVFLEPWRFEVPLLQDPR